MTDCCRHCEHEAGYQHAYPCAVCDEGMAEPLSALSVAELSLRDALGLQERPEHKKNLRSCGRA